MHVDLGLQGLAILAVISLAFGLAAQLMLARVSTRWIGLIGGLGWLTGGFLASEAVFAGRSDLALVDGLAFHPSLVGGFVVGMGAVIATWFLTDRPRHLRGPLSR